MNVPKKFLKSNEIDQDSLKNIKTFHAKYHSAYKNYIKTPLTPSNYKQAVLTWLFSFPKKVREQICSIENKWATIVIHQLYIQTLNKPMLRFILRDSTMSIPFMDNIHLKDKGLNMSFMPDTMHFLHYFAMVSEKYEMSNSYDELLAQKFIKEIQFYYNERSIIEFNTNNLIEYGQFNTKESYCYFKLGRSIIFNKTQFMYYFNALSNERLFEKALDIISLASQGQGQGMMIDYPNWIKQPKDSSLCYSLSEIIAALFEQVITVKFIIANYSNCTNTNGNSGNSALFDINTHFSSCQMLKKDLKAFIKNNRKENETMYNYLHGEEITKSVYYNTVIEKVIEGKCYNMNLGQRYTLYWENDATLDKVCNGVEKYMNGCQDEKVLIDRMLFRKLFQLYTHEDYYQRKVMAVLTSYYELSVNQDLYNELMELSAPGKGKKRRKKKKKKNNTKGNVIQISNSNKKEGEVLSTKKLSNDDTTTGSISANSKKEDNQRSFCFIKEKSTKTKNSTNTKSTNENDILSRFVIKEFMGEKMYVNTYSPIEVMIQTILYDIINSLPLNYNSNNGKGNTITNDIRNTINTLNESKQKKKKEPKFFLYPTEAKKKKEPKKDKKAFITILNNDIIKYEENINKTLSILSNLKSSSIAKVKSHINSVIITLHEIEIYGSYENGLSIEGSDIDILIKTKKKVNTLTLLTHLTNYLVKSNEYIKVTSISTATVPVIKLIIDPITFLSNDSNLLSEFNDFKDSIQYQDYLFDKEDLDYIKIDVTFSHSSNSVQKSQGDYIKKAISNYPQIRSIVKIIKRILNLCNMNNSYTGGLASYSIFLLVYAYQKSYAKAPVSNCYSHLLLDFLNWYSGFDYCTYEIDVSFDNPFVKVSDVIDTPPVIIDPLTKLNAARSSFKILEVKEIFIKSIEILNQIKVKYNDNDEVLGYEGNCIMELMNKLK